MKQKAPIRTPIATGAEIRTAKAVGRVLPVVRLLQFLPDSPDVVRHACDGSGDHGSCLGSGGPISGLTAKSRNGQTCRFLFEEPGVHDVR